jgi:hypothetical protein
VSQVARSAVDLQVSSLISDRCGCNSGLFCMRTGPRVKNKRAKQLANTRAEAIEIVAGDLCSFGAKTLAYQLIKFSERLPDLSSNGDFWARDMLINSLDRHVPFGTITTRGYATGAELSIGRNFRLALWENRTGHPTGRFPHYHRRGTDANGNMRPGQGIGRHRPWDKKSTDTCGCDRF